MPSLFTIPSIEKVSKELVENFCAIGLRETTRVEYKRDFPTNLDKSISAFANTFGGLILVGVECNNENQPRIPVVGIEFKEGLEERILQICSSRIHPPVWPTIWVARFPEQVGNEPVRCVIVMRVEESHDAPHSLNDKQDVYFRTASVSQPFRRANVDEIAELLTRRKASVERRRLLLERSSHRATFFFDDCIQTIGAQEPRKAPLLTSVSKRLVSWKISCVPMFPRGYLVSSNELESVVNRCPVLRVAPGSASSLIHSNWRLAQESLVAYSGGRLFQFAEANQYGLFCYMENSRYDMEEFKSWLAAPLRELNPSFQLGPKECRSALLGTVFFLPKLYGELGFWGSLALSFRAFNARGYVLFDSLFGDHSQPCPDDEIEWSKQLTVTQLSEDLEFVYSDLIQHFYSAFGWNVGSKDLIEKDVTAARQAYQSVG